MGTYCRNGYRIGYHFELYFSQKHSSSGAEVCKHLAPYHFYITRVLARGIGCTLVGRIVSSIFIAVHSLGRLDRESEVRGGAADALVERKQLHIWNSGSGEQGRG